MDKSNFLLFQLCFLFFCAPLIIKGHNLIDDSHNPYRHVEVLDPDGKYKLEWLVDWEEEKIFFDVAVKTNGFIKFGISRDTESNPEREIDFIIGGVDIEGKSYFSDRYSVGNDISVVDGQQDWVLHSASNELTQEGFQTFLSFSRRFDTGDSQDIPINNDTLILVWGNGITDHPEVFEHNIVQHGDIPMYLLDPDLTPLVIQGGRNVDAVTHVEGTDVKIWSISSKLNIPTARTTYWCRMYKIDLSRKHHIIGYTFNINNETKPNVHHVFLFYCRAPNPTSIFEPFINHPGEGECYAQSKSELKIPFKYCSRLMLGYAVGARSIFYPDTMGIPIGESGQTEYFILQTHYDNPTGRSDLWSEITIDAYYTSNLRPHDGGVLTIGHGVPGSPAILLPPGLTDHKIHGHCGSSCTEKILPSEGIKVVATLLHAHNAGRRLTAQHFRGNQELPAILDDHNWQFNFQPLRLLRDEVTVLPGDQITINCHYDTVNQTLVGGYGTDKEMCLIFTPYYTVIEDYSICSSGPISFPDYATRYLAGLKNATWDWSRLEFVATEPENLVGRTISEISDSFVEWTDEKKAELQTDHNRLRHEDSCRRIPQTQALAVFLTPHISDFDFSYFFKIDQSNDNQWQLT